MTDLAGNTATTNFSVTLDYTTATNPPVVNLIWPQDGMAVCGTNITIRGTMSDETGTIMAQIVDEDGNTNTNAGSGGTKQHVLDRERAVERASQISSKPQMRQVIETNFIFFRGTKRRWVDDRRHADGG